MPVQVAGKQRAFGFKFLLPPDYPAGVPLVFLDEPEIPEVVEMLDYVDRGNRIECAFLGQWRTNARASLQGHYGGSPYNLVKLSSEVYNLYSNAPPLPFDEM